jgi:hypothetical protein
MSSGGIVVEVAERVLDYCREPDGKIRVEDAISAAAAVAGEVCLSCGVGFDPEKHDWVPGQGVFSDQVNRILIGDTASLETFSPKSVFGVLQASLPLFGATSEDMPALEPILHRFTASVGKIDTDSWGWVPLTVPQENRPRVMPLRVAFELRKNIRGIFDLRGIVAQDRPLVCAGALGRVLYLTRDVLKPRVALLLASETLIGMSKTAPITAKHLSELR